MEVEPEAELASMLVCEECRPALPVAIKALPEARQDGHHLAKALRTQRRAHFPRQRFFQCEDSSAFTSQSNSSRT